MGQVAASESCDSGSRTSCRAAARVSQASRSSQAGSEGLSGSAPSVRPGADLRGVLVIEGAAAVGAIARLAAAEALAAVVRSGARAARLASEEVFEPAASQEGFARRGSLQRKQLSQLELEEVAPGLRVEVTRSPPVEGSPDDALCLAYCIRLGDPDAAAVAHATLEREAAAEGKRRLLPRFAVALGTRDGLSSGGGPGRAILSEGAAFMGELRVAAWTIEHTSGPRRRSHEADLDDVFPGCPSTACCGSGPLLDDAQAPSWAHLCIGATCGAGDFQKKQRTSERRTAQPPMHITAR